MFILNIRTDVATQTAVVRGGENAIVTAPVSGEPIETARKAVDDFQQTLPESTGRAGEGATTTDSAAPDNSAKVTALQQQVADLQGQLASTNSGIAEVQPEVAAATEEVTQAETDRDTHATNFVDFTLQANALYDEAGRLNEQANRAHTTDTTSTPGSSPNNTTQSTDNSQTLRDQANAKRDEADALLTQAAEEYRLVQLALLALGMSTEDIAKFNQKLFALSGDALTQNGQLTTTQERLFQLLQQSGSGGTGSTGTRGTGDTSGTFPPEEPRTNV